MAARGLLKTYAMSKFALTASRVLNIGGMSKSPVSEQLACAVGRS